MADMTRKSTPAPLPGGFLPAPMPFFPGSPKPKPKPKPQPRPTLQ